MQKYSPPTQAPDPAAGLRKNILYVEDEDSNWDVTSLRLNKTYNLIRAATAKAACDLVSNRSLKLEVILMDIQLHGSELDGIQLTRLFRGALPIAGMPSYVIGVPVIRTPIIFVTAYGARYTEEELINAGGNMLVTKPVDFATLTLGLAKLSSKAPGQQFIR